MSEYHAAVGLAELDEWVHKAAALRSLIESYRSSLAEFGLADRFVGAPEISLAYALFRSSSSEETTRLRARLLQHGIDTRLWYSFGLQNQPYFSRLAHDDLAVTDSLASCLVGLPVAPDLTASDVARVAAALASTL
jgi:dTDP-4-amino-4,6-dideoxygalactose transaminase